MEQQQTAAAAVVKKEEDPIWFVLDDFPAPDETWLRRKVIVFPVQPNSLQRRNVTTTTKISLEAVVRFYCQARIQGPVQKGDPSTTRVELGQLYDCLGLLRSLQYDVRQYNHAVVEFTTNHSRNKTANANAATVPISAKNERRYLAFRFMHQAMAFGVRLPTPWQQTKQSAAPTSSSSSSQQQQVETVHIAGLDELVSFVEEQFQSRIQQARDNVQQHGIVDFDSLHELYQPGMDLLDYGLLSGLPIATTPLLVTCRASHYHRGKSTVGKIISTFHASCEFVIATGSSTRGGTGRNQAQFAVVEARISHYEFKGTRRVADLVVEPNDSHSSSSNFVTGEICTKVSNPAILRELKERGQIYQEIHNGGSSHGKLVNYTAGAFWPVKATILGNGGSGSGGGGNYQGGGGGAARSSRTGGRLVVDTVEAWSRGIHPAKAPADGLAGEAVAEAFKTVARLHRQQEKPTINTTTTTANTAEKPTNQNDDDDDDDDDDDIMNQDILFLRAPLPDSLVTRTWPVVCGFSMETRMWGLALVECITPVQFQEKAFDDLVLPPARKRLLRALITSHGHHHGGANNDRTKHPHGGGGGRGVDVLPGKGEGIIFLLHGPAGVGKTLTAEAISEVLHRPLYRVSMGELGVTPETLEVRLQDIFDLCLPWQALVLIDEAEMLLEKRTSASGGGTDLVRNAMVCVMLRLMEYYPGILFLTTNSGKESLDPAIASRLTCTLGYDALDERGRREIWKTTLGRVVDITQPQQPPADLNNTTFAASSSSTGTTITEADLDFLAREYVTVNGRQIKNAVQLAAALCRYEQTPLQLSQLQETLEITNVTPTQTNH